MENIITEEQSFTLILHAGNAKSSFMEAINMIINGECGQFNPLLMEVLKSCEKRLKNIREYSVV